MQIPVEWYTHLIPGLVLICSILPFIYRRIWERVTGTGEKKLSEATIGALVLAIGICSYVVGFAENAFIRTAGVCVMSKVSEYRGDPLKMKEFEVVRRVNFNQKANPELVHQSWDGYNAMVFQRSLAGSFLVFVVALFLKLRPRHFRKRWQFWALLVLFVFAGESLVSQWWAHRRAHIEFMNAIASIPWELQ